MITLPVFNTLLIVMALTAVVVFISLHFVSAGYGMMYTRRWGPSVDNRLGWVMMEAPVFIAMCFLWSWSPRQWDIAPLVIFCLFQAH